MYSTFFSVALFFTFAINVVFADFAVSTPEIFACKGQEAQVSWQKATAPYNLIVVAADDPCGDALVDAGDFQQTFAAFKVDALKAGQKVQVSLEDATGEEGWSGVITVQDCSAASSSASVSASASASVSGSSASDAVAATTLIVTPTYSVGAGSSTPSGSIAPVGAAANAANPFGSSNSASVPRHLSIPALAFTAIGGAIALLL